MRRIAVVLALAETDPEVQDRIRSFQQGMRELGWIEGQNIRIDYRFAAGRRDRVQTHISELVAAAPEVILVNSTPITTALHQATRTIPIVFAQMIDPVAGGVAQSLAKPGGNVTGLMDFEFAIVGKWLELLKEVAPKLTQVSVLWTRSITYAGLVREPNEPDRVLVLEWHHLMSAHPHNSRPRLRRPRAMKMVLSCCFQHPRIRPIET